MPVSLYTAHQVRELDRRAIEDHGIDGYELMQRAAHAAHAVLRETWPQAQNLWFLCGPGNNGGDALVQARLAREGGLKEQVVLLAEPDRLRGAARQALEDYLAAGGQVQALSQGVIEGLVREADVIVDGLLGTGLDRDVDEDYAKLIGLLLRLSGRKPILSLDIPSGLNADTGQVMGIAVKADVTVSFIGLKVGLFTADGPEHSGQHLFSNLDVPGAVYEDYPPVARRITDGLRKKHLPRRSRSAHKGHHGRVLCVGGDYGTAGAIRIASEAALRSGAGLVYVATRPEIAAAMAQAQPELMAHGLTDGQAVVDLAGNADVLLLGPGLGQAAWGRSLWTRSMTTDCPMVLDADGLNFLAGQSKIRDNWVLTPHPGEAGRLLGTSSNKVQADRVAAVDALLEKHGGTVVLKGPGTLVKTQGGELHLCDGGNPGMAVGGMGDLLAGIIAGLLAQGLSSEEAACLGVYLHAQAADAAADKLGERGLLPSDLWPWLRHLLNP